MNQNEIIFCSKKDDQYRSEMRDQENDEKREIRDEEEMIELYASRLS